MSDFRVVVDAQVTTGNRRPMPASTSRDNIVKHGFRDTLGLRLGGSYNFDAGRTRSSRAAASPTTPRRRSEGWERADIDGAARNT